MIPLTTIKDFTDSRSLVSIAREGIDDLSIQGFIVDYDSEWIMLQVIYDFHLNGFHLLRIADVTSIKCDATNTFQKQLLENDGVLKKVNFSKNFSQDGLTQFIQNFPSVKITIIENERADSDIFLIGRIVEIIGSEIAINYFSGDAQFEDEPRIIDFSELTSILFDTNYTLAYERHFSRNGKSNA